MTTEDNRLLIGDASKWQIDFTRKTRTLDLRKAKDLGVDGFILKFMEDCVEDRAYRLLLDEVRKYFDLFGFYWMHRYDKAWQKQIDMVSAEVLKTKPTLGAYADWEYNPYMGSYPTRAVIHKTQDSMLTRLKSNTAYTLGLYCSRWTLWDEKVITKKVLDAPLWVATLMDNMNFKPDCGPFQSYFLQQYTSNANGYRYGFEEARLDLSVSYLPKPFALMELKKWIPEDIAIDPDPISVCDLCATCSRQDWMLRSGNIQTP